VDTELTFDLFFLFRMQNRATASMMAMIINANMMTITRARLSLYSGSGCGSTVHPSTKFKSQHAVVVRWVSYSQQATMSVPFSHGSYSSISSKFWN